jgi:glycolate oxidase subunit GlcD
VDGEIVTVGGGGLDSPGFDLTGLTVGSEGTFGIVTQVVVKLLPLPSAVRTLLTVFGSVADASRAVSDVIGARIIPTALELMDRVALQAIEAAFHAGYPPEAEAVLLIEVEGLSEAVDGQIERIETICRACSAIEIRVAATESERAALWAARKGAASAMGRIAPNYYLHDTVIARTRLPDVLAEVIAIGQRHELTIANLFHAGDGNLHPMIMFDVREPGALDRVMSAGHEILRACVAAGGTISGEHGIGIEKNEFMSWIFNEADLATMAKVRAAVDPIGLMNPGKVLPTGAPCMDTSTPRRVMEAAAVAAIAR